MALEIKRPLVEDLFSIGFSMGNNGNNTLNAPTPRDSYQPQSNMPAATGQQQGDGGMGALASVGGKLAAKGASNYATTGSLFGGGTAAAGGTAMAAGGMSTVGAPAVGYGLGSSLVGGTMGASTMAGGAAATGAGAAAGTGASMAAGGAAAGTGAASSMSAAGPIGMIIAAAMMNEQDSINKGLRSDDTGQYVTDLFTGAVLGQDIEGKWAPAMDSVLGEDSGFGNDMRVVGSLSEFDLGGAWDNLKKSSLFSGFGLF